MYLSDNADSLASCCRLRNEVTNNEFSFTTGLTGIKTGSCNVITLNLNRNYSRIGANMDPGMNINNQYSSYIRFITQDILKSINIILAIKQWLYELEDKGMLTASKADILIYLI